MKFINDEMYDNMRKSGLSAFLLTNRSINELRTALSIIDESESLGFPGKPDKPITTWSLEHLEDRLRILTADGDDMDYDDPAYAFFAGI